MDRLLAAYRVSSSVGAVVALVGANLIPLAGVLWWGWDIWTILALYWVENGIVGLYNVAKILLAQGTGGGPGGGMSVTGVAGLPGGASGTVARVSTAGFFVIHYGIFWMVHGFFVLFALPVMADTGTAELAIRARLDLVLFGAIGLTISHGVAFWTNYLGRREYLRVSPQRQMWAPYSRLMVLHMTIIFGAFLSAMVGTSIGALIVLVVLKTALDVGFHLREHRAIQTAWDGASVEAT
jgi:hypothetical protein